MLHSLPFFFASPRSLVVALLLLSLSGIIFIARRPDIRRWPLLLLSVGCVLIALAGGDPSVKSRSTGSVAVMVDLSPSTRGATFRNRSALDARLRQLMGSQRYKLLAFADSIQPLPNGEHMPDIPVNRTVFNPPPTDAVVLFSDGRFELPATGTPIYPVIDPALNSPGDAAVTRLESSGPLFVAGVENDGRARTLHWSGATPLTTGAFTGSFQQYARPDPAGEITAALSPGDRWPENDSLSIRPMSEQTMERWWVGGAAPAGWRSIDARGLPSEASGYLQTSAIVLRNIPADSLSSGQQQRLVQYVRDLGGSLIVVGGDQAFAAGGYDGNSLDSLLPLESSPPKPTTHWMLLVDGSGSMAAGDGIGTSPWKIEMAAISGLLPQLPPNDSVNVGSFAETLSWWSSGKSAKDTALMQFPPASAFPHGPTNLAPVLQQIIASHDGAAVVQLLVMTDADTELPNPDSISAAMIAKKIHLHVLATGHGGALSALRAIAAATAGSVVEQMDPRHWVAASRLLLKNALPARYDRKPIVVQFNAAAPAIGSQTANEWNRTWLRADATLLARGSDSPLAATWQNGLGRVTAIAYPASDATINTLSAQIEAPPRNPQFAVTWENGSSIRVTVNAVDGREYLNDQNMQLELRDANDVGSAIEKYPLPQSGPGKYELTLPATGRPRIAAVSNGSQVIERFVIAGRYAPEFDAIGNDIPALSEVARRTGGLLIPADSIQPINFRWPSRSIPIAAELAIGGFVSLATAMVLQRRPLRSKRFG